MASSRIAAVLYVMAEQLEAINNDPDSVDDKISREYDRFDPGAQLNDSMAAVRNIGSTLANPYLAAFNHDLRPMEKDMLEISMINRKAYSLQQMDLSRKIVKAMSAVHTLKKTIDGLEAVYYGLKFYQRFKDGKRETGDETFAPVLEHDNGPVRLARSHAYFITEPDWYTGIMGHKHHTQSYLATDGTYDNEARKKDVNTCLRRIQTAVLEFETFQDVAVDYPSSLQKATDAQSNAHKENPADTQSIDTQEIASSVETTDLHEATILQKYRERNETKEVKERRRQKKKKQEKKLLNSRGEKMAANAPRPTLEEE